MTVASNDNYRVAVHIFVNNSLFSILLISYIPISHFAYHDDSEKVIKSIRERLDNNILLDPFYKYMTLIRNRDEVL